MHFLNQSRLNYILLHIEDTPNKKTKNTRQNKARNFVDITPFLKEKNSTYHDVRTS